MYGVVDLLLERLIIVVWDYLWYFIFNLDVEVMILNFKEYVFYCLYEYLEDFWRINGFDSSGWYYLVVFFYV